MYVASSTDCDAISNEGSCYRYFSHNSVDREQAKQECKTRGYTLATIRSSDENAVLLNTATQSVDCWIGFNDIQIEGTYVWDDGSNSTFTNWNSNEPNNASNEDCVQTLTSGKWNDLSCSSSKSCFYCSKIGKCHCGKFVFSFSNFTTKHLHMTYLIYRDKYLLSQLYTVKPP